MRKFVRISRYRSNQGLGCVDEVDEEVKQRLLGNASCVDLDSHCLAVRKSLFNYKSISVVVKGMGSEEYKVFRKNYLRRAVS